VVPTNDPRPQTPTAAARNLAPLPERDPHKTVSAQLKMLPLQEHACELPNGWPFLNACKMPANVRTALKLMEKTTACSKHLHQAGL